MPGPERDAAELAREYTKAELREMAYNEGMSIPRGTTKMELARMLAVPFACDSCGEVVPSGLVRRDEETGLDLCSKCREVRGG